MVRFVGRGYVSLRAGEMNSADGEIVVDPYCSLDFFRQAKEDTGSLHWTLASYLADAADSVHVQPTGAQLLVG